MPLKQNILNWLVGNDTGLSSRAIVFWMERGPGVVADGNHFDYPHDPADLGRCIRLLDIEPSYRARLEEMSDVSPEWARLVSKWDKLEALFRAEAPSGRAPRCYRAIQRLIQPERGKAG